jgi:hypothetical protein
MGAIIAFFMQRASEYILRVSKVDTVLPFIRFILRFIPFKLHRFPPASQYTTPTRSYQQKAAPLHSKLCLLAAGLVDLGKTA